MCICIAQILIWIDVWNVSKVNIKKTYREGDGGRERLSKEQLLQVYSLPHLAFGSCLAFVEPWISFSHSFVARDTVFFFCFLLFAPLLILLHLFCDYIILCWMKEERNNLHENQNRYCECNVTVRMQHQINDKSHKAKLKTPLK